MSSKIRSSYPIWDCKVQGHSYRSLPDTMVQIYYGYLTPLPDDFRQCENCHNKQVHWKGSWFDATGITRRVEKKPVEIDPNQLSLF